MKLQVVLLGCLRSNFRFLQPTLAEARFFFLQIWVFRCSYHFALRFFRLFSRIVEAALLDHGGTCLREHYINYERDEASILKVDYTEETRMYRDSGFPCIYDVLRYMNPSISIPLA